MVDVKCCALYCCYNSARAFGLGMMPLNTLFWVKTRPRHHPLRQRKRWITAGVDRSLASSPVLTGADHRARKQCPVYRFESIMLNIETQGQAD